MASVMDMDGNFLIMDEIVLRDRVYKLEQFRQFYDLQPVGELRLLIQWRFINHESGDFVELNF